MLPQAPAAPAPATEPADPAKDVQKPQYIPKARFDEVNNEKNTLKSELAEAQRLIESLSAQPAPPAKAETPPAFDEDAQEVAYAEALMDGDATKAAGIRREINANIRAQATQ